MTIEMIHRDTGGHNPERKQRPYERDILHGASLQLDEGLIRVMPYLSRDETGHPRLVIPEHHLPKIAREVRRLHKRAIAMLDQAEIGEDGNTTWTSYYRLLGQTMTAQIRHQAELGMMLCDESATRKNMVNGLVGIHVSIAKHALEQYDAIEERRFSLDADDLDERQRLFKESNEIRGVISEHTILALLNYDQSPNHYGVIPMLHQDLRQKTDVMYYYTDEGKPFRLPIQIKTSRSHVTATSTPRNGITLVVNDYLPTYTSETETTPETKRLPREDSTYLARLLVKQHEPEELTPDEERDLIGALAYLQRDLKKLLAEQPGIPLLALERMESNYGKVSTRVIAGASRWVRTMRTLERMAA